MELLQFCVNKFLTWLNVKLLYGNTYYKLILCSEQKRQDETTQFKNLQTPPRALLKLVHTQWTLTRIHKTGVINATIQCVCIMSFVLIFCALDVLDDIIKSFTIKRCSYRDTHLFVDKPKSMCKHPSSHSNAHSQLSYFCLFISCHIAFKSETCDSESQSRISEIQQDSSKTVSCCKRRDGDKQVKR